MCVGNHKQALSILRAVVKLCPWAPGVGAMINSLEMEGYTGAGEHIYGGVLKRLSGINSSASQILHNLDKGYMNEDDEILLGSLVEALESEVMSSKSIPSISQVCGIIASFKKIPPISIGANILRLSNVLANILIKHEERVMSIGSLNMSLLCEAITGLGNLPHNSHVIEQLLGALLRLLGKAAADGDDKPSKEVVKSALTAALSMPSNKEVASAVELLGVLLVASSTEPSSRGD